MTAGDALPLEWPRGNFPGASLTRVFRAPSPCPVPERRYSDEEVKRILASAVESDAALSAGAPERGMTLAEIQRIGAEAGLSTASVNAAAVALDHAPSVPATQRVLGLRVGVEQTVALPRPLDDAAWRRLVGFLRDTFEAQGRESDVAGLREWRNGNLRVVVEPAGDGALLQMRTRKSNAGTLVRTGASMLGGAAILGVFGALAHVAIFAVPGVEMLVMGGAVLTTVGAAQLPGWSAARQRQFEAVAEYARQLTAG